MYDPPVEVKIDTADFYSVDNEVLNTIQSAGIRVDRRELFRALNYDRGQYEKGYADGRADAMRGIMVWLKSCPAWPETKKDGAE